MIEVSMYFFDSLSYVVLFYSVLFFCTLGLIMMFNNGSFPKTSRLNEYIDIEGVVED